MIEGCMNQSPYKRAKLGLNKKHRKRAETTKKIPCSYCGRTLWISFHSLKKNHKNYFCDRQCGSQFRSFKDNPNLKGGYIGKYDGYHYIMINGRRHLTHRIVMERHLGRSLMREEHVHHKNGIRNDNRIENLALVSCHAHPTQSLQLIQELQARIRELESINKTQSDQNSKNNTQQTTP